jgi:hypothetical protein
MSDIINWANGHYSAWWMIAIETLLFLICIKAFIWGMKTFMILKTWLLVPDMTPEVIRSNKSFMSIVRQVASQSKKTLREIYALYSWAKKQNQLKKNSERK